MRGVNWDGLGCVANNKEREKIKSTTMCGMMEKHGGRLKLEVKVKEV